MNYSASKYLVSAVLDLLLHELDDCSGAGKAEIRIKRLTEIVNNTAFMQTAFQEEVIAVVKTLCLDKLQGDKELIQALRSNILELKYLADNCTRLTYEMVCEFMDLLCLITMRFGSIRNMTNILDRCYKSDTLSSNVVRKLVSFNNTFDLPLLIQLHKFVTSMNHNYLSMVFKLELCSYSKAIASGFDPQFIDMLASEFVIFVYLSNGPVPLSILTKVYNTLIFFSMKEKRLRLFSTFTVNDILLCLLYSHMDRHDVDQLYIGLSAYGFAFKMKKYDIDPFFLYDRIIKKCASEVKHAGRTLKPMQVPVVAKLPRYKLSVLKTPRKRTTGMVTAAYSPLSQKIGKSVENGAKKVYKCKKKLFWD